MRLKSIKLAGFKSFVDPTTVNFPSNLCAVVGPNGCGKSNIIDAVRWVMGESSAKNLRGESMTDVIFNGSGGRKPVGQASIELVFDNSDATITGEYAGYSEIAIKRRVTRDSQNIYYLNGNKCRRRDITDIFLGTGLGPRSYAIIEQGMISRLIEARPEDLRIYIEEAAGISKYKERRRDTENRMRRTMENLERLTDIREELDRQLVRLERQAQAAEKYTELKKEEREVKAQLQALRYALLQESADAKQAQITELELAVEAGVTEQVKYDSSIEKYRTEFAELGDTFNEVQGKYYSIGADITRIEQSIQHALERERSLKIDLEQTERDCRESQEILATDKAKAEGWQAELLEIEPDLEMIQEAEETSRSALMEAEDGMHTWQQNWDSFNQTAAEPRQRAEVQQSRIKYLEQVQQRLIQRIEKLEAERDNLIVDDVAEEIEQLDEDVATFEMDVEQQNEVITDSVEAVSELRESQQQLNDERDELRGKLQSSKGRLASLEALQQAAMGQASSSSVSQWLTNNSLDGAPRLADEMDVSPGWERAAEVVLGKALQAVCSEKALEELSEKVGELDSGSLLLMSRTDMSVVNDKALLLNKITSPSDLSGFLNGIYVAEDLTEALNRVKNLASHESVITKEGIWLGPNWVRVYKDDDAQGGVIERKREIDALILSIDGIEESLVAVSDKFERTKQTLIEAEAKRESARQQADNLNRQLADIKAQLSARKARVEQVMQGRERAERDISEAKTQLEAEAENLSEARAILEEAIMAMESDTEEREKLLAQRDAFRASLDNARQKARHDKDKSHELAMRYQSVKTQLDAIQQGIQRLTDQMERLEERRETLKMSLDENADPVEESKMELEGQLERRIKVEQQLADARLAVETVETSLRETEKLRQNIEQQVGVLRGSLESARIQAQTFDVQSQGVLAQLKEADFDLQAIKATLTEEHTEEALEDVLRRVGNRIERLGAINLAAIEEYKTEAERKHYLDSQDADLREALDTLEGAIKRIDKETRTRFKETFDKINNGLQELFPKVFGGGHAYLELTGEDMLDTGIAIMARPPGKKNSTIHLLSGGEKALTAIALVFSIFRLNPAPFCMLDEVDAPLDDANVGRYARMVEEMSSQVQFIYITHNKIAMEMATQLMGVTMHEPGVSRMVTVDVEQAAELASQ